MATINAINSNIPIEVSKGGLGDTTLTQHGVLVGNGTSAVGVLTVGTNGQVLLGSTGANPVFATLTSSSLSFTTGAGTLAIDITAPVSVANGGTGSTSFTNTDGVLYYDGTKLATTTVGTSGYVLTSNGAGVAPTFQVNAGGSGIGTLTGDTGSATGATVKISGTTNQITTAASGTTVTVSLPSSVTITTGLTVSGLTAGAVSTNSSGVFSSGTLSVANGGTGATTLTSHGVLVGAGTSAVAGLTAGTNGQVLVGSTGANPVFATLTSSTLTYTTGAGTLAIDLTIPVPIASGGTNATSMTNTDGVVYYDGTKLNTTAVGTSGQFLVSNGAGVAPTFQTIAATGITILTGDSGSATGSSVHLAGTANQIVTSGSSSTLTFALTSSVQIVAGLTVGNALTVTTGGLTVSAGGAAIIGTTTINTSGSAVTTIGTGGTGAVNIGNATGNTSVTGTLTSSSDITSTTGTISTTNNSFFCNNTDAAANGPFINYRKNRSGGVITPGDDLGTLTFQGYDGTQFTDGARIRVSSPNSSTIATHRLAGDMLFYTHPDSTTGFTLRMTIGHTGEITIAAPDSGTGLTIAGGGFTSTGTTQLSSLGTGAVSANSSGVLSSGTLSVANGGSGNTSYSTDGVLYYDGTKFAATAVGTAGQVLTSNGSGVAPTFQAVGGGGGGLTWNTISTSSQTLVGSNGYLCNNAGTLITFTLPATSSIYDIIQIVGKSSGGWKIAQNANQVIEFGAVGTTTGTGGSISSTQRYDCISMMCVIGGASSTWVITTSVGNLSLV